MEFQSSQLCVLILITAMPSVQINVYQPNSASRSRSTGRRSRSNFDQIEEGVDLSGDGGDRSTTRRSLPRRRRRHRRNNEPPRNWVGTQEPSIIWRGASLMPSVVRDDERRHSGRFLV